MKLKTAMRVAAGWKYFRPVTGAALAVLFGLILWGTPLGSPWVNASFDYQFWFGSRAVTNNVLLIQMDNESYRDLTQERLDPRHPEKWQPWNRKLHADLLNRLADGGASLVVMDTFFRERRDPAASDEALAAALRRQRKVVLMAEQAGVVNPRLAGAGPTFPDEFFLNAAGTNWGVAWVDKDVGVAVREQWPFPSPGPYHSLAWTAALLAGAHLDEDQDRERWLRYYHEGTWKRISYRHALEEPTNSFRDKIVFIGSQPHTTDPDDPEVDKFQTSFTRWTGEAYGGVDINITAFLNLMNSDWLERPPGWAEAVTVVLTGILLGGGLCRLRPLPAMSVAAIAALAVTLGSVSWSYYGNRWFPWLVIAGGQVPLALVWAIFMPAFYRVQETITVATLTKGTGKPKSRRSVAMTELPDTPDYELFDPPFGEGAYGKVWVVKNAIEQWQALKVVYLAKFDNNTDPFDREFNGISRYKRISDGHPGLLRVDFVSRKRQGYFYYVMELGDARETGWEKKPSSYRPRDLVYVASQSPNKRLPVRDCLRLGITLSDALEFLHQQGLTHRDIKPQNIIFVNGHPKLADVGLTAEIRPPEAAHTFVGTPGYMPPPPERPGTVQADIYALGMVLYVASTGRAPAFFPEIATTLVQSTEPIDFLPLNAVILKACEPDRTKRYETAAELNRALQHLESTFSVDVEKS